MKRILIEAGLVVALFAAGFWIFKLYQRPKQDTGAMTTGKEVTVFKHDTVTVTKWRDADSALHATVKQIKAGSVGGILPKKDKEEFDNNTLKALQVGTGAVTELKKLDLVSSGKIKTANVQVAPNKVVTVTYTNGFLTFKSKVDSTGKPLEASYTYNNKIQATDYTKKKVLFFNQQPQDFTDIKSSDPQSSIDSLRVFQFPSSRKRDLLQLIWENEAQFTFNRHIEENQVNSGLLLKIAPDNFVTPSVGIGAQWNYNGGQLFPYWKLGLDLNLIRWKR